MPEPATITIVCLGATDNGLRALLRDVFDDMGLRLHFAPLWHCSPDLVLAAVQRRDAELVLAAACEVAGAAPILAILPYSDERLVRLVRERGAHACYALDTPLAALRAAVDALFPIVAARRAEVSHG
ncbi:MAG: hypothetical protein MUC69_00970 [Gemmatimonadales bacterium]|jgi:hypothetical protein|nr:hypothetical protein [Gemmatimonadales bacterium]